MRKIIISAMFALASSNVFAMDLDGLRQSANVEIAQAEAKTENPVVENVVPENLITGFKNVCNSRAVKSKKLTAACEANELPKTLKSGKAFRASGIGAEVNTLIANYEFIK